MNGDASAKSDPASPDATPATATPPAQAATTGGGGGGAGSPDAASGDTSAVKPANVARNATNFSSFAPAPPSVRVRLLNFLGVPIADTVCDLEVGNSVISAKTNATGVADFGTVPFGVPNSGAFVVHLNSSFVFRMPLTIQDFADPNQSPQLTGVGPTGARARLNNMGYMALGAGDSLTGPPDDNLKRGLQRFQNANFIFDPPTTANASGILDGPTQNRLQVSHDIETLPFVLRI
jgi:hypothetical protein